MSQRRLIALLSTMLIFCIGLIAGLTAQQYWTPPKNVVPPAKAAVVSNESSGSRHHETANSISTERETATPPQAPPANPRETQVTTTVRDVSPSVVTVGAVKRRLVAQPWFDSFFLRQRYRYFEQKRRMPYMGSGFLIDNQEGLVLTNYHVIDDSERVFVTFPNGLEIDADVIDADNYIDMALLKLQLTDETRAKLPEPLEIGTANDLMIGERVMAIGNPFGNLIEDSQPTVTVGYVSALHRSFRPDLQNRRVYSNMIQTDAAINPGNSGGPLVNIYGDVVGMNTFIFSPSGGNTGIGFAIPAERLRTFVNEIKKYGRLRPLLMDFDFRTIRTRGGQGVQVTDISKKGPGDLAGLRVGDIVVEVDGKPISSREEFYLIFASRQVGETLEILVERDGQLETIEYIVEQAPDDARFPSTQI